MDGAYNQWAAKATIGEWQAKSQSTKPVIVGEMAVEDVGLLLDDVATQAFNIFVKMAQIQAAVEKKPTDKRDFHRFESALEAGAADAGEGDIMAMLELQAGHMRGGFGRAGPSLAAGRVQDAQRALGIAH